MHNLTEVLPFISDAVWSFDLAESKFSYVNQRLADIYEIRLQEIEKKPSFWLDFIHPEDYNYVLTETKWAYRGKQIEIEYRLVVNEKVKWVQDKRIVVINDNGKRVSVTGILSDITSKKNAEIKLSESEITFRYLFINNPNPLWIYDTQTLKFLAVNYAAISKYGYSKDEFLSMTISDIRPKEDKPSLLESIKSIKKDQFLNSAIVWRHLKKNKDLIYVNISGHSLKYQGRDAEIVMAHDVTDQVHSKQEITLAKENLDALINNIDDQIWSIDSNYNILSANIPFKLSVSNIINREINMGESIFFPEFNGKEFEAWKKHYDKALSGQAFQVTEFISQPGVTPFYSETKFSPIIVQEKIIGVACISRNIQERLETQRRILEQNAKLLELISIVSHEIRGPIVSILGLTNVFNDKDYTDPFNGEVINLIQDLTKQLDKLIYTLVDKTYALQQGTLLKRSSPQNQSASE